MAGELFGIPNGLRAYQDDQNKLTQLASNVALQEAQIRNFDTDNAQKAQEFKLKQEAANDEKALRAKLAELANGGDAEPGAGGPLGGNSVFDKALSTGIKQAQYLLSTGRIAEAGKLLPSLTNGVKDLKQARHAAAEAKESAIDAATKRYEFTSQILSGAVDQASYDQARMAIAASPLFTPDDLKEMPDRFDPRFVRGAIAGSKAAKQKADLAREASRTEVQNANDRDQIEHRRLARDLAERTHELAVEREARLKTQGAARVGAADKPLPPASAREVEVVRAELKRLGLKVGDAQADLVSDIAEQVKTLVDGNPGLSRSEASARVVAEMETRGELSQATLGGVPLGGNRYQPKEGSVTMPLPTPKTAAELKKGHYYLDAEDGLTKLFDGKGFKVATKRRRTDVTPEE